VPQDHGLAKALDQQLITMSHDALEDRAPVRIELPVANVNRTVGTMLGHEVTKRYPGGLPDGTIDITLSGAAGQSLGAFLPAGITLRLFGEANDYVAKGLSGGRVVVRPLRGASLVAEQNVVAGNVIGYGATSGQIFLRGVVGERFCVRNSGATAVVEGVGDHGLEYMTGGTALILGPTGRNLGAGMSGGVAYVLDLVEQLVNRELVDVTPLREQDLAVVHDLLEKHHEWTESAVAAKLLAEWPVSVDRFSLVLPRAYQQVLDVRARAADEGLDPDGEAVWERIMEVSRG
jgi:glutamate synthase (NADPH/NADH) large chain